MNINIEFNPAAFKHGVKEEDIRWAFDTVRYDGRLNDGDGRDKDKYLLIGFDRKGNPIEVMYNYIDANAINVFHAMKCRSIYHYLLKGKE